MIKLYVMAFRTLWKLKGKEIVNHLANKTKTKVDDTAWEWVDKLVELSGKI